MKRILKSVFTIAAVLAVLGTGTKAYFSSTVTAQDNVITTGTLLLAVDTAQNNTYVGTWGFPNAWEVVRQNADGSVTQSNFFIPWTGAAPGESFDYFVGVRNAGTIDANIRATATGAWVSGPGFGTDGCPATAEGANASLVSVTNVHLYAAAPGSGCESHIGCRNLRDGLLTGSWMTLSGLTAGDKTAPDSGMYFYGTTNGNTTSTAQADLYNLGGSEFVVYRVTAQLDGPGTNNCYQGATYNFDFTVEGKQYNAPAW